MITQIKNKLYDLAVAEKTELGLLRGFKTILKGDWAQIPQVQQPSMSIDFADNIQFEGVHRNPERYIFDFYLSCRCSNPMSPEQASEQVEKLVWDSNSSEDWGALRFALENPSFDIQPSGHRVRMSLSPGNSVDIIMEKDKGNFYTASAILHLIVELERGRTI